MTQELIERTAREWVSSNAGRAARDLERLSERANVQSAEELIDALVRAAARLHFAETRAW